MSYSKAKLKSSSDKASPCLLNPYLTLNFMRHPLPLLQNLRTKFYIVNTSSNMHMSAQPWDITYVMEVSTPLYFLVNVL
jgi:hypothetical protein